MAGVEMAIVCLGHHGYIAMSSNINPLAPQIFPRHLDLPHQLLVRVGHVIECEYTPSELKQEIGSERYDRPKGKLEHFLSDSWRSGSG